MQPLIYVQDDPGLGGRRELPASLVAWEALSSELCS